MASIDTDFRGLELIRSCLLKNGEQGSKVYQDILNIQIKAGIEEFTSFRMEPEVAHRKAVLSSGEYKEFLCFDIEVCVGVDDDNFPVKSKWMRVA